MKSQFEGHTLGPWEISHVGGAWKHAIHSEVRSIGFTVDTTRDGHDENEANARLMAAAPDLLAENNALRAAFAVLKELQECSSYWSEYYVPIGIHERIAEAVRNVEALDSGGSDESGI